ncbi:efflux RND transporter periplasmic adaptor subunit [Tuberibacillus sp. Marseille-P3662]|uniref:efflux RND transporter periplasmic adaptor subunit n=1 Tax=Tuberibacillus sp. Marseille-P3662 TaxID=1965358 RepID=UPI000A1C88AD|nr:efflux RND transporter periplasmic adaptor subunit [Tuberibacillus sp. Marseille-P3662]
MKPKQKLSIWVAAIVVFIGVNVYLIYKDSSAAERLNYVSDWERVTTDHLVETIASSGVVAPATTERMYFDPSLGSFQSFFVQKGDTVESGDPLYEYAVTDAAENRQYLEGKIDKLEGQIDDIELNINQLETLKDTVPEETENEDVTVNSGDQSTSDQTLATEYEIEMKISQNELKRDMLETKRETYESQLQSLMDSPSSVTVTSPYSGVVQTIHHDLNNPVIAIASEDIAVHGKLSEQATRLVKSGMKTYIRSSAVKGKRTGTLTDIKPVPVDEPETEQASKYAFTVELEEQTEDLQVGYHTQLAFVIDEAQDALVLPEQTIETNDKQDYTWVLSNNGTVIKQQVKTGLQVTGDVELTSGAKEGTHVVQEPEQVNDAGAGFITPLKWDFIDTSIFTELNKHEVFEHLLLGVLE